MCLLLPSLCLCVWQSVQDRIELSSDAPKDLRKYISPANLPQAYGGENRQVKGGGGHAWMVIVGVVGTRGAALY